MQRRIVNLMISGLSVLVLIVIFFELVIEAQTEIKIEQTQTQTQGKQSQSQSQTQGQPQGQIQSQQTQTQTQGEQTQTQSQSQGPAGPDSRRQSPHQPQSDQQPPNRIITHRQSVSALPSQNKRWALVIGVDKYEDSNISALKGAANDARGLKEVLVKFAGFPEDQVIVLSSNEPFERQPTRRNILRRLSNLAGLVPQDGLLLISFAGHGIDRNGQGFLIPSDATFTEDTRLLEETAISVNSVKERIKATAVQQVMIFLDACRSYPTGRSDSSNPLTPAFTNALNFDARNREVNAFAILYATEVGSRAYEYGEKHQGYFTWAITQALKGAAANERGDITLGALVKYLESTVPKLVAIDYGAKVIQRPFANIEGYRADELVLASIAPGKVNASPSTVVDFETALWNSIKDGRNPADFESYLRLYPEGRFAEIARGKRQPVGPVLSRSRGHKSGKVLYSSGVYRGTHNDTEVNEIFAALDEFRVPLISFLEKAGLTLTNTNALDERDRLQIRGLEQDQGVLIQFSRMRNRADVPCLRQFILLLPFRYWTCPLTTA